MKIGVPKEIKNHEHRVSMMPDGVRALCSAGHTVFVQAGAGVDSGFLDDIYRQVGAVIVPDAASAWAAELVVKVKEPQTCEYSFMRPDMMLFTYLHLAADPELAAVLMDKHVCAIGYETVQLEDASLPLLAPMSRVAGRVAVQLGARFLQQENGTPYAGKGVLAGSIEGGKQCKAVIIGAGHVGLNAASALAGLGAQVVLMDSNKTYLDNLRLPEGTTKVICSAQQLRRELPDCDLLIGAALIPGEHAPELLTRDQLALMYPGSVFVDVSIDQGGIAQTSRPTSYDEPIYVEEGVIHCCLPNLPGAVPRTSTHALCEATLPYILELADGVDSACAGNPALNAGINIRAGRLVHAGVAKSLTR